MAGSSNDTVMIIPSPENSGFPPYLDFTTLRTNAINYLGPITGKYWTDYNVHDPGITTLEVLMYAIVDLGYRVNLPIGSLLAPGTGATGAGGTGAGGAGVAGAGATGAGVAGQADTNFFTPAQVLGCNPTTILDYRKLLMDLDEVRNAWLEVDQTTYNGLYKIYLQTEKAQTDFSHPAEWDKYKKKVRLEVKKTLHAFRNLCEDFEKIVFLKNTYIGVDADIEVVPGTDTGVAYQALVATLYDFFSPVPTFYTLGQLTTMSVSLATVFEGRPYTQRPSHGFLLDEDMPDRPSGEQTISKSVLIQTIQTQLQAVGIKTIRSLTLLDENGNPITAAGGKWEYSLPADSLSAFSLAVSTFRWYQNGQLLSTQLGSYNAVLQMNSLHSGKVIYPAGSVSLDLSAPYGAPLNGLGDYYSIQNDYPQVYGIGAGGLPPTVTTLRKSQALQFKGYLLFFDQLLSDYLAQLSNLRQVFAMNAPSDGSTSFGGRLGTVPDLDKLLRFPPTDAAGGATLLYPVAAKAWDPQRLTAAKAETLPAYTFDSSIERDTVLATVIVLFSSAQLTVQTFQLDNNQWKYYLTGTDDDIVLVSRNSFTNQAGATGEAATVLYIGAYKDNYSLVSLGEISSYTFNLVASGAAYYQYLQSILESPQEFTDRRTAFVEHLLSRFAETFTDYALLEAGFAPIGTVEQNQLSLMQQFLGEWPALSADRGKAFDLRLDGWNSVNTSGLEARFKAYCGIDDPRRHYLCHFEVQKMEERFHIALTLAEEELFTCREPLKQNEAVPAVFSLFAALSDRENYRIVHRSATYGYCVEVVFYGSLIARSVREWPDEGSATVAIETLCRMWQMAPSKGDSVISQYQYRAQLLDHQGRVLRTAIKGLLEEHEAFEYGVSHLGEINDEKIWKRDEAAGRPTGFDAEQPREEEPIGRLYRNRAPELGFDRWIDTERFKIYPRQNVLGPGKSDRWSFEVLDEDNSFRFESTLDFDTEPEAIEASYQLLHFLCETEYYAIRKEHEDWYKIVIRVGVIIMAIGEPDWDSETSARERIQLMVMQTRLYLYRMGVISRPHRWKFLFYMGMPERGSMVFESVESFGSQNDSMAAARLFHQAGAHWKWRETGEGLYLEAELPDGGRLVCHHAGTNVAQFRYFLETKQGIYRLAAGDEESARRMTVPDETSKEGPYVYRLVDKDHPRAFHPVIWHHDKTEAETARDQLIAKAIQGYVYLEICLGGDNIREAGAADKFYYQLKCRNEYLIRIGLPHGREMVLFESVDGFADADSAQAAFQQTYLSILGKAEDPDNYGHGKYILPGDRETIRMDDDHKPVVLIPAATREAFLQAGLEMVDELVKAARSYPIRREHKKYRFILSNEGITDWVSAHDYLTPADAHSAFDFFLILLNFSGNFFIEFDWKECAYRVGVREVLAESTHRFHDEAEAWGPRGVEKFICVAQHKDGFHLDRKEDCTYSFFVACPNPKAMHPCTYESAAQRDRALFRLIKEAGYFYADGWIDQPDAHHFRLLNGRGHPLARVPMPSPESGENILNRILDIEDAIWAGRQPERYGSGVHLVIGDGANAFAITPAEDWSEHEWMRRLSEVTTYFPVTREGSMQAGVMVYSYRMELKLPGFEDPPVPASSPKDCGCPPSPKGEPPFCYLAWKDTRVFTHAALAWEAWLSLLPVIAEKENYRPVFGAAIGCYGIELHDKRSIVARNPQTYTYPAMDVDAMGRARARIDSEGLDIVEHILLRPGMSDKEIPVCDDAGPCSSTLPFQPGADPYSFVLTVALPAWPARFRKTENRVLLESILQREMPAHILARILWLTPRDMCKFEHLYAGWIDALAREATDREDCGTFKVEEFLNFLFRHAMACLGECRECGDEPQVVAPSDDGGWLSQINHLFCWKDRKCAKEWKVEMREEVLSEIREVVAAEIREEGPVEIREEFPSEMREAAPPDPRMMRKLQASRRHRYEKKIADWQTLSGEEKPAENVRAFLLDPIPSTKRLEDLLKELLKKGGKRGASAGHHQELAGIVLSIYLDRIIMEANETARWDHLRSTVKKCGVRIADAAQFYCEWRPDEMRQLAPDLDEEKIQSLIRDAT